MALVILMPGCGGGSSSTDETPTSGNIKLLVDDSFRPMVESEVNTFVSLYENAKIKPVFKPEVDIVNDFMHDSAEVMLTSWKLTEDQVKYLRDTLIVARTATFAWDAIALVINRSNPDSLIKYDEVRDIFAGRLNDWSQINPKSHLGKIKVIFDNTKSGNIRYFKERFNIKGTLPDNFFSKQTSSEVIDFVSSNKDAIGILSANWISDKDDPLSNSFINRIKVVAVSQPYVDEDTYYRPKQGNIYDKSYPFVREIFIISRETFYGLGSGFMNWACAEQGQRIVLKSGLVPATMPIRLVQIKHQ
ncbi:MAG TPA: substrate-binding domain-containing protein [Bacteroidales bacterium]|nr:substrate-binding domain-containing protein [Bacteroidales bacterium]